MVKGRRDPELNRYYLIVGLIVTGLMIFQSYKYFSSRISGEFLAALDAPSRWILVGLGLGNALVVSGLLFLIARAGAKLYFERRRGLLGSKLRTKLAVSFFAIALIPSLLLYLIGQNFISKNIAYWFKPETQTILLDSCRAADWAMEESQLRLESAASQLKAGFLEHGNFDELRDRLRLDFLALYPNQASQEIRSERLPFPVNPGMPPWIRKNDLDSPEGRWLLREGLSPDGRWYAAIFLPREKMELITRLQKRQKEGQQVQQVRLETLPQNVFLFLTLLTLFASIWTGLALARSISDPVKELAKAAQRVGAGDLDVQLPEMGEDELAYLSQRFNGMIRDLKTNQELLKDQAERIERSRAYLGHLLAVLPVGILSWRENGELRLINDAALEWLDLMDVDPETVNWLEIAHRSSLGRLPDLLIQVQNRGLTLEEEFRLGQDGNGRPVRAVFKPTEIGVICVLEDLTALAQAEKRAAWQEVARRMAHEVKNPLTPIQLTAQRLLRRGREGRLETSAILECAEIILTEVKSLNRLVDSFSRFAKLPAPHCQTVDAAEIARQVLGLYLPNHPHIQWRIQIPEGSIKAELDADMIKRALVNLVDNALAVLAPGNSLRMAVLLLPGRLRYEIENDGPSIPLEDRNRIFEPYFSTKRKGTGLGLAIVRKIAEEHHGLAGYQNLEPHGSLFWIEVPGA